MATTDERLNTLETTFKMFMQEMRDFKTEMRDRDNQRAEEIRNRDNQRAEEIRNRDNQRAEELREIRQRQDAAQAKHDADFRAAQEKHDADMKEMREDIKGTLRHIQNLTIASMVGIGAIAVATWVFVLSNVRYDPPPPPAQITQVNPQTNANESGDLNGNNR